MTITTRHLALAIALIATLPASLSVAADTTSARAIADQSVSGDSQAPVAGRSDHLNLRPPLIATRSSSSSPPPGMVVAAGSRSIRLEPVRSIAEWGVDSSREALAACQRGPYPGATVSAYSSWTSRSNAQPDHCYRF